MKRKIILSLSVFSLFFIMSGIYIITTIEDVTSKQDHLITLHQVEILREHLLMQIKKVQANLNLKNTRYARSIDTVISDVKEMEAVVHTCSDCHHTEEMFDKINDLEDKIHDYRDSLSRVLTISANVSRLDQEEDNTFRKGEGLIEEVNNMINISNLKLEDKTKSALREVSKTKIILYILIILGPVSIGVLAVIFIKGFTKPINALLYATRKLNEGDLDYKIEKLEDEFGVVALSFNEMSGSLKEQMHKMQRAEQMVVAGELSTGLAHEIKNPLAGIKVSMEVLAESTAIQGRDRGIVLSVAEEIKRIELLLKNLLNFAKPPKPELVIVDINNVLEKTINFALSYPSMKKEGFNTIKIVKDFDYHLPRIKADLMQLQQVFINLLLNASEAMPDGGTLTLKTSLDIETNSVRVEISDTGKGIDRGMRSRIFQPFFTTKSKGTGLGLSISKRLIEQHGGDICLESSPGKGTSFNIYFPANEGNKVKTA